MPPEHFSTVGCGLAGCDRPARRTPVEAGVSGRTLVGYTCSDAHARQLIRGWVAGDAAYTYLDAPA